jgi:pyrroline-5-carboxylate reductase
MKTLSFAGGGRITRIILKGLSNKRVLPDTTVYDISEDAGKSIQASFEGVKIAKNIEDALKADVVVIALMPKVLIENAEIIRNGLSADSFVLTLAPKCKLSSVLDLLGITRAARMNPSAPSIVNKGFNPVSFSKGSSEADKNLLRGIFGALGEMPEVEDRLIDAFAVVSAMGYTYFDYQFAMLASLAKEFGVPDDLVTKSMKTLAEGVAETVLNGNLGDGALDLVPARPLKEIEETVKAAMRTTLTAQFEMLTK